MSIYFKVFNIYKLICNNANFTKSSKSILNIFKVSKVLKKKTEDGKTFLFVKYEHYPIRKIAFQKTFLLTYILRLSKREREKEN